MDWTSLWVKDRVFELRVEVVLGVGFGFGFGLGFVLVFGFRRA